MDTAYDPARTPDPEGWLALGEPDRYELVIRYHRRAGLRPPNAQLHALIHVMVENQAALGDKKPVAATLARLCDEGLDRHQAVHAVGSVLLEFLREVTLETDHDHNSAAYFEQLGRLTAQRWRDHL